MVVKLLINHGDVDIDSEDIWGWTPLAWAAKGGHKAVVKLLAGCQIVGLDTVRDRERCSSLN